MELTTQQKALLKNAGINPATAADSYHRHINPNGRRGAWVHNDAQIEEGVFLGPKAVVKGQTHLRAGASLHGAAVFGPHAETRGNTVVKGNVRVFGEKDHPTILDGSTATGNGTELFSSRFVASKVSAGVSVHQSRLDHSFASGRDTRLEKARLFNGGRITAGSKAVGSEISNGAHLTDRSKALANALISGPGTVVSNAFVAHNSRVTRGARVSGASLNDGSWVHGSQALVRHASLVDTEVNNSVFDQRIEVRGGVINDHRHALKRARRSRDIEPVAKNPSHERIQTL